MADDRASGQTRCMITSTLQGEQGLVTIQVRSLNQHLPAGEMIQNMAEQCLRTLKKGARKGIGALILDTNTCRVAVGGKIRTSRAAAKALSELTQSKGQRIITSRGWPRTAFDDTFLQSVSPQRQHRRVRPIACSNNKPDEKYDSCLEVEHFYDPYACSHENFRQNFDLNSLSPYLFPTLP